MTGDGRRGERMRRLDALKDLLAAREFVSAAELATDLGVTVRTVHRDLAVLRDLGVPIEGGRGRGGGLWLEQGWSLGRVHLNESEALGLLLSLTIAQKVGSPLMLDDLRSITRKVAAAFAPAQARRILALRRRILIGTLASERTLETYQTPSAAVTRALLDAFVHRRTALVQYEDRNGLLTEREIEPQYLYYNLPIWYTLAWDRLRDDVRFLRIDRFHAISVLPEEFRLRRSEAFLAAGEPGVSTI
ncbi:MAG: HTH domain-containing protein [Candidatus Nanopelagicales bacterium]